MFSLSLDFAQFASFLSLGKIGEREKFVPTIKAVVVIGVIAVFAVGVGMAFGVPQWIADKTPKLGAG